MRDESGSRASRWSRRGLRIGGGLLGLAALLYAAAAVLLHLLVDPTAVAGWVEPRMERAIDRDVEVEAARVRIFPHMGAELRGVRVSSPPDIGEPPLAEVASVRLRVALLPLLRSRIRVDEIRVEEPSLHLTVGPDGRANYEGLAPRSDGAGLPSESPPMELAVRRIAVRGGSVAWVRMADSVGLELSGLEVDGGVVRVEDVWSGEIRVASERVLLRHPVLGPEPVALEGPTLGGRGRAGGTFGWVELEEGRFRLGDAVLELTGRLDDLKEPVRRMDVALRAEALEVASLLEALPGEAAGGLPGRADGTVRVELSAEGPLAPGERPDLDGSVTLASGEVRSPEGEAFVEELGGRLEVAPEEVAARGFDGSVLGGDFSLEATLRTDSSLAFRGRLAAAPRLDGAAGLAGLPEGIEVAGRIDADLTLSGTLREIAATRLDGTVRGRGLRLEHPELGVPVTVEDARVLFEGRRGRWNEVSVGLGRDRLSVSGTLDDPAAVVSPPGEAVPRLDLDLRGARLDLDAVFPSEDDPGVTYGRIAFAHLGGRTLEGRSAEEWARRKELVLPDSLPVSGEARIRLDTLRSEPYRLTDLRARVLLAPDLVEVADARFLLHGGEASARMSLGVGSPAPQPFTFTAEVRDVAAADFLAVTSPLGPYVRGRLSLDLDLAGALDGTLLPVASVLAGSGRTRVRDGGLEENPLTRALARTLGTPSLAAPRFRDWTAPFRVEGSTLRFDDVTLAATRAGELRYGGGVGLDGALDLGVRLALSAARLDSAALDRSGALSAVVGRLAGGEAPVAVGLEVGGTIQDPVIRPRAALATGELREALEAEAEARTDAFRDTARARLEEARDTAAARIGAEGERVRRSAQEAAREAREELEERARNLLRDLARRRDTASVPAPPDTAAVDTTGVGVEPDTAAPPADTVPGDTTLPDTAPPDSPSPPDTWSPATPAGGS